MSIGHSTVIPTKSVKFNQLLGSNEIWESIEWAHENKHKDITIKTVGVTDHFIHRLGNQEYTRGIEGIDYKALIKAVKTQNIKLGICLAFPNRVRKS